MNDKSLYDFRKINVGCGNILYPDYLNIGYWEQMTKGAYGDYYSDGRYLLNWDLTEGIPLPNDSIDIIYGCHFLEHLSFEQSYVFLQECFRCMSENGLIRIVVPDLNKWVKAYIDNNILIQRYKDECMRDDDRYDTPGMVFMGMLHGHGHRFGWDFSSLSLILSKIGFVSIKEYLYQESEIENILDIERCSPLRALESLAIECRKP